MDVDLVESRLRRAWSSLAETVSPGTGWQTIALSSENGEYFRAGVLFPEKNESVLVHFELDEIPKDVVLPSGGDFLLSMPVHWENEQACGWLFAGNRLVIWECLSVWPRMFSMYAVVFQAERPNRNFEFLCRG